MKKLMAGKLAKEAQIGFETIRYYERRGILPKPNKSASGYREYSEETVERIRLIKKMQRLGFSLIEIKRLLLDESISQEECKSVERKLKWKVSEIEKKIFELQEIKSNLSDILKTCQMNKKKKWCPLLHEVEHIENCN